MFLLCFFFFVCTILPVLSFYVPIQFVSTIAYYTIVLLLYNYYILPCVYIYIYMVIIYMVYDNIHLYIYIIPIKLDICLEHIKSLPF